LTRPTVPRVRFNGWKINKVTHEEPILAFLELYLDILFILPATDAPLVLDTPVSEGIYSAVCFSSFASPVVSTVFFVREVL